MNLIRRIFFRKESRKKVSRGIVNGLDNAKYAKYIEVFSNGCKVELRGRLSEAGREGFLEVKLKQLLENLESNSNTDLILKDGRINFLNEEAWIYFPSELRETDWVAALVDSIIVKKSDLVNIFARQ